MLYNTRFQSSDVPDVALADWLKHSQPTTYCWRNDPNRFPEAQCSNASKPSKKRLP